MIPTLERSLRELEALLPDSLGTRELCTLWLDLVEFRKYVDVIVRSVEEEATESLIAEVGEVSGKRSRFDTPAGPVRLDREPPRRRTYGRAVLERLSLRLHDEHGEIVSAVPIDTLRAILPAAAASEQTSYGWRWKELRSLLGDEYPLLVDETPIEDRRLVIRAGESFR